VIDDLLQAVEVAVQCRYVENPGKADEAWLTYLVRKLDTKMDELRAREAPPVDPPLMAKYFPGSEIRRVAALSAKFLAHARAAGFHASSNVMVDPFNFERDVGELATQAEHLERFAPKVAELLEAGHTNMGW